jgi:hypothetical protein
MVRIKLLVRIIPEDVYVRDVESPTQLPATLLLENEMRLKQVVNDPENVTIGMLANEIKANFQRTIRELVVPSAGHSYLSFTNLSFPQSSRRHQIPQRWRD